MLIQISTGLNHPVLHYVADYLHSTLNHFVRVAKMLTLARYLVGFAPFTPDQTNSW